MSKITALNVNGKKLKVDVDSATSLLAVLRNDLDLTGSKYGCGEGECGACTVLIDGLPTKSCIMPVGRIAGKQITTIEGLEKDGRLIVNNPYILLLAREQGGHVAFVSADRKDDEDRFWAENRVIEFCKLANEISQGSGYAGI